MGLFKSDFEAIAEATKSDICKLDNVKNDIDWASVATSFEKMGELQEGVYALTAEMIPLVEATVDDEKLFLVEMSILASFMKSSKIDSIREAIEAIALVNDDINEPNSIAVVVDDDDVNGEDDYDDDEDDDDSDEKDFEEFNEAVKQVKKKKALKKKLKAAKIIDLIKDGGNKVFKSKK